MNLDGAAQRARDRLRIVTINSHQPYLYLLGGLPHDFLVIDRDLPAAPCAWDPQVRPLPGGWRTAGLGEARAIARERPFDLALAHNVTDLLALRELCERQLLLIHCSLTGRIAYEGSQVEPAAFAEMVARYLSVVPARVVFVSELKRRSWPGLDGAVIDHAVRADVCSGWTGELPAVLRVSNLQRRRDVLLGHGLQQEALTGIPNSLIGVNPDVPGSTPAASWDALREAYREHRCFLVTNHPEHEDGYNLSTLEAMATGMPIVTTPHPTSPIRHGWEGLVGADAYALRRHVTRLLMDRQYAARLGAQARLTVLRRFLHAPFLAAWDRELRACAAGAPAPARPEGGDSRPRLRVIAGGGSPRATADTPSARPHLSVVEPETVPLGSGPSLRGDGGRRP